VGLSINTPSWTELACKAKQGVHKQERDVNTQGNIEMPKANIETEDKQRGSRDLCVRLSRWIRVRGTEMIATHQAVGGRRGSATRG
jgi:hypothetical protein